jgi:HK97 gp10 family phage protein
MAKLDRSLQTEVHRYLVSWAADVKAEAKRTAPVKTGYLRSTIYAVVKDWIVNVGAEAAYAYFVEMGTRRMAVKPFLYPSIVKYLPELDQLILAAIDLAKQEAGL